MSRNILLSQRIMPRTSLQKASFALHHPMKLYSPAISQVATLRLDSRDEKDHLELKRLADQVFEQVADVVSVTFFHHFKPVKVVNHLYWLVLFKVLVVCIVKPVYLVKGDVPFLQF